MHKSDSEDRDDVWANIDAGAQMRRAVTGAMEDMFAEADTPEKVDEMADHVGREAWRRYVEGIERTVAQEANYARHNVELTDDGGLRTGESWHGTDYDPDGTYSNYAINLREVRRAVRGVIEDALANLGSDPHLLSWGLIEWLDAHAGDLRALVPEEHVAGLDALFTLVRAPETYETDTPRATASRWTVELREPWRSGVAIVVHTADGQAVTLRESEDRLNSAIGTFTSGPVDVQSIARVEVIFAPEEATKTVIRNVAEDMGIIEQVGESIADVLSRLPGNMEKMVQERVEKAREHILTRLRISAHTDVSEELPRSKTYEILDYTASGEGDRLTASNHSIALDGVDVPNVDFLLITTRRYRDYSRVEKLVRHIEQNRMAICVHSGCGRIPIGARCASPASATDCLTRMETCRPGRCSNSSRTRP